MTDRHLNDPDYDAARAAMVASQLRTAGVSSPRLLGAMGRVARERFVPAMSRANAYIDRAVPLSPTRALNPPVTTAQLIEAAAILPDERVLVVGVASGYALAVCALLSRSVVGVESDAALGATARDNVAGATVIEGALENGAADHAPFDVIVIDGAVTELPEALVGQLAPEGRLATALIDRGVTRLAIGRRGGTGFALVPFDDGDAVVLPGFARPKAFVF